MTVMPPQEDTGDDLWLLVSTSSDGSAATRSSPSNLLASAENPALAIPDIQESSPLSPPTALPGRPVPSLHAVTQPSLRWTACSTAGQHSNLYHLPQGVASGTVCSTRPASQAVSAFFRPWN